MSRLTLSDSEWVAIGQRGELSKEDIAIVSFLAKHGSSSMSSFDSQEVASSTRFSSRRQLARVVADLCDNDWIQRSGQGRSTYYVLNTAKVIDYYLALDITLRSPKPFNIERILAYIPNEHALLPEAIRRQCRQMSDEVMQPGQTLNNLIFNRIILDLCYASSKMEGNTYTRIETEDLLEKGILPANRTQHETQMILNHADAVKFLLTQTQEGKNSPTLSLFYLRSLHKLLSQGLLSDPSQEGDIRQLEVRVSGTTYITESNPHVLRDTLETICQKANQIVDPYEASFFLMVNIAYLQAFADVNKRTGRLATNIPLMRNTLCPLTFYNCDDREYIQGLIAYYEIGEVSVLANFYQRAYRESTLQYKTYLSAVTTPRTDIAFEREANRLCQYVVRQICNDKIDFDEWREAALKRMDDSFNAINQDRLLVWMQDKLKTINEIEAFTLGITRDEYSEFSRCRDVCQKSKASSVPG